MSTHKLCSVSGRKFLFFVNSFVARPTASQLPMWGIAPHLLYHGCGVPVNPTRGAGSSVQNVNVSVGQCTGAMSGGGAHNRAWIHPQVPAGTAPQTQQQNTHSAVLSQHLATHFGSPTHNHQVDQTPPPPPPDNFFPRGVAISVRPV